MYKLIITREAWILRVWVILLDCGCSCGCCCCCNIIKRLLNFAAVITSWASTAHKIAALGRRSATLPIRPPSGSWFLTPGPRILGTGILGCRVLDAGCWMLDAVLFLGFMIMMRFCYGFLLARARAPGNGNAIIIGTTAPHLRSAPLNKESRLYTHIRIHTQCGIHSPISIPTLWKKFSCTGKHFFLTQPLTAVVILVAFVATGKSSGYPLLGKICGAVRSQKDKHPRGCGLY